MPGTGRRFARLTDIMATLIFKPEGVEVQAAEGETILDAALDGDVAIAHDCGGNGICGTCHIIVEEGLETLHEKTEEEIDMLEIVEGVTDRSRLACQCEISGDLVLLIPPE